MSLLEKLPGRVAPHRRRAGIQTFTWLFPWVRGWCQASGVLLRFSLRAPHSGQEELTWKTYLIRLSGGCRNSFPHFDDPEAVQMSMMPFHFPLQDLASTPGPVTLINSVLIGAFAGILAVGLFSAPLFPAIAIAASALVFAFVLHRLYEERIWRRETRQNLEVRFPSPKG